MDFSLPPEAVKHFNDKAKEFLYKLKPLNEKDTLARNDSAFNHKPVMHFNHENIINLNNIGTIDGLGNKLSHYFVTEKGHIGLDGNDYKLFVEGHFIPQCRAKVFLTHFIDLAL